MSYPCGIRVAKLDNRLMQEGIQANN
jgi:hypothetical protein